MKRRGIRAPVLALLLLTACGAPAPTPGPGGAGCVVGQTISCACPNGARGVQTCTSFGTYGSCSGCSGSPTCTPACSGRNCGNDGCGGSCGSCEGSLSCLSGTCGVDPSSQWVLTIVDGTVSQRGPDGSTWDGFGGAPDPFVCVTVSGTRHCTRAPADTFSPAWNYELPVATANSLRAGIVVAMYDEDVSTNDTICGMGMISISLDRFAAGGGTFRCDYMTVNYTLQRRGF